MKHIKWIALIFLFACAQVRAASFDCAQARTNLEKLICSNNVLSELDTKLGVIYSSAKQNASMYEAKRLVAEQLQWLRNVRSQCADTACLTKAYTSRLNALDPFADQKLTCDEMRKFPAQVFSSEIDLGSGSGSPIDVDYRCPESLSQQEFMQKLLALTEQIRGDDGPQICSGTIVHALWRYYHFSLTTAGFAPRMLTQAPISSRSGMNWNAFSHADESGAETRVFRYFKQWSERSQFNFGLYKDFTTEVDLALPLLAQHFELKLGLPRSDAQAAAKNALMLLVQRAAGSFPGSVLAPESPLVEIARSSQSTSDEIRHALSGNQSNRSRYSEEDIYQALLVALINNRSPQIVAFLAESLPPEALQNLNVGQEPLLSFAMGSLQNLEYLLSKNVPMDAANDFGKTVLFYAIGSGNHKAVETLLKSGANANATYKSAKELRPNDDECIYPDLTHTRRTPLMHAAQNSDTQMLKRLVEAGASLSAVDDLGYNALDYAAMGKNNDNANYLKSLGLQFGAPKYTSDPDPSVREQTMQERLAVDGYVGKLLVAPQRPELLAASVTPWDTLLAGEKHGLYLISIADPNRPTVIANFRSVYVSDFALSPDGKRAYLMEMSHDKTPPGKKFGLSIIDISVPQKPLLKEQIEGDFMTMQLSPDGSLLYLQERSLKEGFSRGLLVYDVGGDKVKMKCSNPFGKSDIYGPVFAYSFASFPDEPLLLIHDRSRSLILFDVAQPCAPKRLSEIRTEKVGYPIFGGTGRTIVNRFGGLQKSQIADSLVRLSGYEAEVSFFFVNPTTGVTAAVIDKDVAIFRTNSNGQFVLTDRFRNAADNLGGVLQTNSGHVYVGWKGGLGVGVIP
jgi:hypothetical protein